MNTLALVMLALLAGVVLYQLYAVLGKKVGRQPGEDAPAVTASEMDQEPNPAIDGGELAAIKARDPSFDPGAFLSGAKSAYEMIVRAFAEGDLATLRNLVAPEALRPFEAAIDKRQKDGVSEKVEFRQSPRADIEGAEVIGDRARVIVRFLAEFMSRTKGPHGEAVDDRRTAELWTFEREIASRDPNWTLVRVAVAAA
ncbi:MAG: TIM44-related membrane protein TimA [Caulobacteraceae bacterium]